MKIAMSRLTLTCLPTSSIVIGAAEKELVKITNYILYTAIHTFLIVSVERIYIIIYSTKYPFLIGQ